ncbi:MAG: hypothetical protein AAF468_22290 [Pseudomonadota bacterium]
MNTRNPHPALGRPQEIPGTGAALAKSPPSMASQVRAGMGQIARGASTLARFDQKEETPGFVQSLPQHRRDHFNDLLVIARIQRHIKRLSKGLAS